jgi:hypothetical protein
MLKIRWRISHTDRQNSHSFVHSSYSLPDVSAGRTARELWCNKSVLVDESGVLELQRGQIIDQKMVEVLETLCMTLPRHVTSNQQSMVGGGAVILTYFFAVFQCVRVSTEWPHHVPWVLQDRQKIHQKWDDRLHPRPVAFNPFCSRTPRYNFSSTLYPQRCWYIMQVIHIV